MIVFYYTNAAVKDGEQKEPKKSLGGYISSTTVPNAKKGNLFGDLGAIDLQNDSERIIAIAAKNISQAALNDLTFKVSTPTILPQNVRFRFALVTVEDGVMEQIDHFDATPYVGSFQELGQDIQYDEEVAVVSSLGVGDAIGIWVQRVIEKSDSPDCEDSGDIEIVLEFTFAWD